VSAAERPESLLMLIEREKLIIPISTNALQAGQSSRRALRTRYNGALIVTRQGVVRPISSVTVVGLWGSSFWRKLLSALTSAWKIQVHLGEPRSMNVQELGKLIDQFVRYDSARSEPFLSLSEPFDKISKRLRSARSVSEVFEILNVPDPEDCLDVL
jgi:hypothetical protein